MFVSGLPWGPPASNSQAFTKKSEQKREDEARHAAETAERPANFDAASHAHHNTYS